MEEIHLRRGDLNNDDIIDNDDQSTVDNDILNFVAGYVNSDVNGDLVVDIADGGIVGNNVANFVSTIHP